MFYVMKFELVDGLYVIRTVRTKGYKNLDTAKQALINSGKEGFIKKLGVKQPVFSVTL